METRADSQLIDVQEIDPKKLKTYAFLDPGSGKSKDQLKRRSARSAIVVGGVDWLNRVLVLYAWADRVPTDTLFKKIVEVHRKYGLQQFGIEASAQQSLFYQQLVDRAHLMGVRIPFRDVVQPTRIEKDFRIRSAINPVMAQGRYCLPDTADPGILELISEQSTFPMSPTKDLVDALASLLAIIPRRSPRQQVDANLNARLEYLRDVGAPPDYIERVQAGLE